MNKLSCGCTPDASGYGYCYECTMKLRRKVWNKMSEEEKGYDREFAPGQSEVYDEICRDDVCSCHILAPCEYCIKESQEKEKEEEND